MAKLEEITELLVSEIQDFENAVKRLEKVQKAKITIDLSEMKNQFADQRKALENQNSKAEQIYEMIEAMIKEAKIYPNWAVVVFILSLLLNLILIVALLFNSGVLTYSG